MVYYVTYKASEELKNMSRIARRLRGLGCEQIRKSFWEVNEENIKTVAGLLQKNFPLILKRTREIRKPSFMKEGGRGELGSLIVIAYRVPKEEKKVKIANLLKRAPCIRLCRGVYAFCQRQERFDRKHELVDARRFWDFICKIDENAVMIPRLIVVSSRSLEIILGRTRKRVEKEIINIVEGYKHLYQKVRKGEIDGRHAAGTAQKLRKRFINVRKVAAFYEEWLRMDLSNVLVKPYPIIRKVRSLIHEYEVT